MKNSDTIGVMESSDNNLVADSLRGDREAFGHIVARYQTLICSLAYNATGSVSQSQDLAQDTFVIAWKQLPELREPGKLRAWLCAILKNRVYKTFRSQQREPVHAAEPLESAQELASGELPPSDQAITKEEEAMLWRSIERIPETYREALILFYRERQSIGTVAANLDLTEDAVKQRLSRGRKLLHEQMVSFVEGALARTNPGQAFTLDVLAALPALTISAKAATLGAAAAKGSMTAKVAGISGLLGSALSPLIAFLGIWMGYQSAQDSARSQRERDFNKTFFKRLMTCIAAFLAIYFAVCFGGESLVHTNPGLFASLIIGLTLTYLCVTMYFSFRCTVERRKLLANLTPEEAATQPMQPAWEYRSGFKLFGLPFIHIRVGDRLAEPVKAWIAAGDCAFGVLFAFGGLAMAPVCIGGCAFGLFSFGGCAIAPLALGGLGMGVWAFGGLAIGWESFGGCAIAWDAAWGGFAIAHSYAVGGIVHALQANTDAARQWMGSKLFYRVSAKTVPYLLLLNVVWIVPLIIQRQMVKRAKARQGI
ncbi:MAG TPA: sigma-70 family RNA polymerase sigma factor [Verrucomicrobiae bacterium]|jgi:RNA polymerase sigma factor (sigma-70 family)